MKKPALLILSFSALLALASCNMSNNDASSASSSSESSSSEGSSSESSSEETPNTATIKAVYNPGSTYDTTASVGLGDVIPTSGTITYTDAQANGSKKYQIMINGNVADMTMGSDGTTYTYDYSVEKGSELVVAFAEVTQTNSDGYKLTFEQGEHYTIFGITSGQSYLAYQDDVDWTTYNVAFSVIPDAGYMIEDVTITGDSEGAATKSIGRVYRNQYTISIWDDFFEEDSTISVKVKQGSNHTIKYESKAHIDTKKSILPESFVGGDQVLFSFIMEEGYGMRGVDLGTYYADTLNGDYSNYVVSMPDEDITVKLTLSEAFSLGLVSNDKITNVSFYDNVTIYDDEEGGGYSFDNEISTYTTGSGQIVVAFDVVGDYKPIGLVGFEEDGDDDGFYMLGKARDGRYGIKFWCSSKKDLAIDLATAHNVSLDSASDKVEISFSDGTSKYIEDDEVKFTLTVKDEYASSWRIKDVYYCYDDEEYLASYSDWQDCYCFDMPDSDVTIKVEMYQPVKTTVSYANNAGNLASSVSLVGQTSGTSIEEGSTSSASFEEGEIVKVTIAAGSDHSKEVKAYYAGTSGEKEEIALDRDVYSKEYTGTFMIPEGGASVSVEAGDAVDPLKITYSDDIGITFYTSEDASTACSSITVYPMDVFYFTLDLEIPEGEELYLNVSEGYDDTEIGGKKAYKVYAHEDDIDIEAKSVKWYNFSVKDADGNYATYIFENYDGETIQLNDGKAMAGTLFRMNWYYEDMCTITSFTIGGQEAVAGDDGYYVVTGDVSVTIEWTSED